jgi:UDP-3-O-[3-hydroxymyristoyl] glucosamine N-acyltransferase
MGLKTANMNSVARVSEGGSVKVKKNLNKEKPAVIHPTAVIGREVRIGQGVVIGPKVVIDDAVKLGERVNLSAGVYIGRGVRIGKDSKIEPHAVIREGCLIGERVRIQAGAVIGSDGFGFAQTGDGNRHKIPQIGIVEIGDDAVIGANSTVDRATLGRTVVGRSVQVEPMAQIAHNVRVGDQSVIGAHTGICGSSTIGKSVNIGRSVGIVGHVKIDNGSTIDDFAGVLKNVPQGSRLSGFPAIPPEEDQKRREMEEHLPQLYERVREIEKLLNGQLKR